MIERELVALPADFVGLQALPIPPTFKVYVVEVVSGFSPRYEVHPIFDVIGYEHEHDASGYHLRLLTTKGWSQLNSPNPFQVSRNAADIDRMTPPFA